jgi:hypothetical protein
LWNHKVDKWELFIYLFIYIIWGSFYLDRPYSQAFGQYLKVKPCAQGAQQGFHLLTSRFELGTLVAPNKGCIIDASPP